MNDDVIQPPTVISEDDDLLVIDKPGGLVCHSASRPDHPTLVGWVRDHFCRARSPQGLALPSANPDGGQPGGLPALQTNPVRLLNRLDRETSGLIVIAKTERAAKNLSNSLHRGEIQKQYVAICWGEFKEERGVVDKPIGFAKGSPVYTKRGVDEAAGKPSVTEFVVEKRLREFTLVRLTPRTGRTHQLRVHLAWLGYPIVGDKIYGPDDTLYLQFIQQGVTREMLDRLLLPRHALHADWIRLRHPRTQEFVEYRAPMPEALAEFVRKRGRDGVME